MRAGKYRADIVSKIPFRNNNAGSSAVTYTVITEVKYKLKIVADGTTKAVDDARRLKNDMGLPMILAIFISICPQQPSVMNAVCAAWLVYNVNVRTKFACRHDIVLND